MKIAVVGLRGFPGVQGGVEAHCQQLYPRLAQKGCDVVVFTRRPYVDSSLQEWKGVRFRPIGCPRNRFLEAAWHSFRAVWQAWRREKAEILHIHAIGPSLAIPLARILGMKVVMTHHGADYDRQKWGRLAKAILRLGERCAAAQAQRMICISEPIADHMRKVFRIQPRVIPNGVEIPQGIQGDGTLGRFSLEKGRYVLAVGRFVPEKGFHDLVRAFALLQEADGNRDNWKLVIAGRADHADAYSLSLRRQCGQTKNVVLTDFLTGEPLEEIFSHAGIFVLPSYHEGLPIALLEAMSYGLSCLASDIPANHAAGLKPDRYFPPGDVQCLAKIIRSSLGRPLSAAERDSQLERLRQDFDWDKVADDTLDIYRSLVPLTAWRIPEAGERAADKEPAECI